MFLWRYNVRFDDVDAAGIVFYPRFFVLCHMAFEDFVTQASHVSYAHVITKRGIGFPAVHVDANFSYPLYYGDTVELSVSVSHLGTSSIKVTYGFTEATSHKTCFNAVITSVCTNLSTKKSTPIPEDLRDFFAGYLVPA